MPRAKGWTCQRQSAGVKCHHWNRPRTRKCGKCGKPRPSRREPAHMGALELDYAGYVALNGGEICGICGRKPSATRRLDRDHAHTVPPIARGLLCSRCNRSLPSWVTVEWLEAAILYLKRAEERESCVDDGR